MKAKLCLRGGGTKSRDMETLSTVLPAQFYRRKRRRVSFTCTIVELRSFHLCKLSLQMSEGNSFQWNTEHSMSLVILGLVKQHSLFSFVACCCFVLVFGFCVVVCCFGACVGFLVLLLLFLLLCFICFFCIGFLFTFVWKRKMKRVLAYICI